MNSCTCVGEVLKISYDKVNQQLNQSFYTRKGLFDEVTSHLVLEMALAKSG